MEAKLSFRYHREADILYIDKCPPYPEQESEELGDEVVARLNPDTGEIENLEVLFFSTRLLRSDLFQLPVAATLRPAGRMQKLSEVQLWDRVRSLEGRTVFTLVRRKPNKVVKVTDTGVIIDGRRSRITRRKIATAYKFLWQDHHLQLAKEGEGPFFYAVVPAILRSALPEQIEAIPGVLGIRLKSYLIDSHDPE